MRQSTSEPRAQRSEVCGTGFRFRCCGACAALRLPLAPKRKEVCPDYAAREVFGDIDICWPAEMSDDTLKIVG
jgi:hypothetical protein